MYASQKFATAGLCALAAICWSAAAGAENYYYRYINGSWSNVRYNDGICRYSYSYNSYDKETHVNRYGDCSHLTLGPNGEAIPLASAEALPPPRRSVARR